MYSFLTPVPGRESSPETADGHFCQWNRRGVALIPRLLPLLIAPLRAG